MSSDNGQLLDESDRQVWAAIGGDDAAFDLAAEPSNVDLLSELLEEFRALQTRVSQLERDLYGDGSSPAALTALQQYARLPETERDTCLGASERRAVVIYEHWDELADSLPNGSAGVSTKRDSTLKHNPSRFKIDLEHLLGEDLAWEQVYRAMKAVATLSGGEPEPDQYGRTHIVGGLYEFHERTSPDNTDRTTYRVLTDQCHPLNDPDSHSHCCE